jgi:hypothetical protein
LQRMDQFDGAVGRERRGYSRFRASCLGDEAFPVSLKLQEFSSTQLGMIWLIRVLVGPVMSVVIFDAENRQIGIDRVGIIAVDMVQMKADTSPLADAAPVRVYLEKALILCVARPNSRHD